jgi:ferric-dicitrate binding protein FerR (iron transport regulator)
MMHATTNFSHPESSLVTKGAVVGIILLYLLSSCHSTGTKSSTGEDSANLSSLSGNEAGKRQTVRLPGGITVIYQSNTTLDTTTLDTLPHGGVRHSLTLDGDAFFFVSGDTPLTVHTGMLNLTAVRAAFRVRAHRENPGQSMELLRGELIAEKAYPSDYPDTERLHAGDMVMINKDIDLMEKETFDTTALARWLKDDLVFTKVPLQALIRQLEDFYDVEIAVTGTPSTPAGGDRGFTGNFHGKSLATVLDALSHQEKFRYRIKGNQVTLSF